MGIPFGFISYDCTRIILGMGSVNERWHYNVKLSFIGWAHMQNNLVYPNEIDEIPQVFHFWNINLMKFPIAKTMCYSRTHQVINCLRLISDANQVWVSKLKDDKSSGIKFKWEKNICRVILNDPVISLKFHICVALWCHDFHDLNVLK